MGNVTQKGAQSFVYNAAAQMNEAKLSGATVGTYVYNAFNQRISKTVSSVTTHYVYGPGGGLLGEYDSSGALIREYIYVNGQPVAQIDAGSPETVIYLHTDHLMTSRYATNASANTVWTWDSGAFGKEAPSGTATVNLRFPGQYYDSETGLHYNWHRYYDPTTGRYITSDPLGLAAGLNTYGYAAQNPLSFIDRDGLDSGYGKDFADFLNWLAQMGVDLATAEAQESLGILFQGWCKYNDKSLPYLTRLAAFHETLAALAWARANPIPPLAKKVSKTGTATIKRHGKDHFSIEVKHNGKNLETHQIDYIDKKATRITDVADVPPTKPLTDASSIDLPDAEAAIQRQKELIDAGNLGPYDKINNSCISHVSDILCAGGVEGIPEPNGSDQARKIIEIMKEANPE